MKKINKVTFILAGTIMFASGVLANPIHIQDMQYEVDILKAAKAEQKIQLDKVKRSYKSACAALRDQEKALKQTKKADASKQRAERDSTEASEGRINAYLADGTARYGSANMH